MTDVGRYRTDRDAREMLHGKVAVDENGDKVGKVSDVLYDPETLTPTWAVIDLGRFKAEHIVPLSGSYRSADGELVIPFDRSTVNAAPKVPRDHVLTHGIDEEARRFYGVAS